jgi:hypothetical protein
MITPSYTEVVMFSDVVPRADNDPVGLRALKP